MTAQDIIDYRDEHGGLSSIEQLERDQRHRSGDDGGAARPASALRASAAALVGLCCGLAASPLLPSRSLSPTQVVTLAALAAALALFHPRDEGRGRSVQLGWLALVSALALVAGSLVVARGWRRSTAEPRGGRSVSE